MFTIDPDAAEPPFEQLRQQVVALVDAGRLRPGDRLPTVRGLAADLGIAPGTVARAYKDLEQDGVLDGRGRAGTFVADTDTAHAAKAAAADYARRVRDLGVDPDTALALARDALHR